MELADNYSFGSVDDKSTLGRHQRDISHKHHFFFRPLFVLQSEFHVKRCAKSQAFSKALQPTYFRFADLIKKEVQLAFFIVAFDGKNLLEHGLQANLVPLRPLRINVLRINDFSFLTFYLQKFPIGIHLDFNQIRMLDYFFNLAKINPLNSLC